jgi:hypothetical protein
MPPIRRTDAVTPLAERASVYRWSRQKLGSGAPAPGPFYEPSICAG